MAGNIALHDKLYNAQQIWEVDGGLILADVTCKVDQMQNKEYVCQKDEHYDLIIISYDRSKTIFYKEGREYSMNLIIS